MSVRAIRDLIKADNLLGNNDNNDNDNNNDNNDNNSGVEVLDKSGEPVTNTVIKTFSNKDELMEFLNSTDTMRNIVLTYEA